MTDVSMSTGTDAERKLAATRAEFRDLVRPDDAQRLGAGFPRSRTMRALTSGGAASVLAPVAVAILATRPAVASRHARAGPVINLLRQLGLRLR